MAPGNFTSDPAQRAKATPVGRISPRNSRGCRILCISGRGAFWGSIIGRSRVYECRVLGSTAIESCSISKAYCKKTHMHVASCPFSRWVIFAAHFSQVLQHPIDLVFPRPNQGFTFIWT